MLILSLVIGLALGLLAGGSLENLASVRLRLVGLLFLGLVLRYATQFAIESGSTSIDAYRLPLFAIGFTVLLIGMWVNRDQAGFLLAFVGVLLNAGAIVTNGGYMPVWEPSIIAAGLDPADITSGFHKIVGIATDGGVPREFLAQAGPIGDIIPIPIPGLQNVASIGDLFLAAGLAFFLFATTVRHPSEVEAARTASMARRLGELGQLPDWAGDVIDPWTGGPVAESGSTRAAGFGEGGLVSASALERPLQLGGSAVGSEGVFSDGALGRARPIPGVPQVLERVRRHPYVRLALDSSFSALWTGQLVSALGDRIHQVALAFVIWQATGSAIAVGAIFLTATVPNLLFSPLAGTLVDRWDVREVMIVSDLLRAGIVLLIPLAVVTNLLLAYPLVFLVTTVSIFFRPAKGAILPRIVASDDLVPANSALWVGETFADIGGYLLAGLFVGLLGSQLPLAFWVDSVTYLASAILIASIAVAPLTRTAADLADVAAARAAGIRGAIATFRRELVEGWQFLRQERILLANTFQATAGQFMLGTVLALTPVLAAKSLDLHGWTQEEGYAFLEGAIGAGNLVGGFLIGLVGSRLSLGKLVILGYVMTGAMVAIFPLTGSLSLALGVAFGIGFGNLAFVIPSQTLFQRRTPPEMMGRVLGLRSSLVFGSMAMAMGLGGVLGELFGAVPVIAISGLVTVAAGLAGVLVPAVRDA
ncbi:MAG TPA: MFS transporter [Candidatus Limnocylindria bacterium]|nr:MFS transporter [Candidatus Limnocylindria bacterium]